jgi:hypothetical protein
LERYVNDKAVAPPEEIDEKKGDVNNGSPVKVSNPAYEEWFATDQQVLGFLLTSLSRDILVQVAAARTSAEAWNTITDMFASHTRARTINVRLALATTKKDNMTVAQYYGKMKGLVDEMAAAGKPLDNEELVMYICNGLDTEYNSLVSALVTRLEPITPSELYSQLLSFESRLELQLRSGSSRQQIQQEEVIAMGDSKGVASIMAPIVAEVDDSILAAGLVAADVVSSSHHARINSVESSPLDLP